MLYGWFTVACKLLTFVIAEKQVDKHTTKHIYIGYLVLVTIATNRLITVEPFINSLGHKISIVFPYLTFNTAQL